MTVSSTDGDADFENSRVTVSNVRVDGALVAGATGDTNIPIDGIDTLTFRVTVGESTDGKHGPVVYESETDGSLPVEDDEPEEPRPAYQKTRSSIIGPAIRTMVAFLLAVVGLAAGDGRKVSFTG